ncbi:hypothetical protein QWY81_10290 [Polaribacter undariae]|uniref:DUF1826 domain-containing protein n=1 Tax=Polaribacter sejongensis TaxID=985043 RepID=A0AAJ1VHY2_9FLAO|nr:hypothetical protein [Polaribacter undariae]MDN3619842.1 hypothetical protein [Polaribacter undariae]UWD31604.1 hypothetical protein NQP51_15900 [Polaribacter undariae]
MSLSQHKSQIYKVDNFNDLLSTKFKGDINAICWNRNLKGDFSEIVNKITLEGNMSKILPQQLLNLKLSEQGQLARETLLNDFKVLKEHGKIPTLNIIKHYERDDAFPFFPTDVYSYHVDRSPIPADTFLCTYHGASSDILPNSQGIQKILIPEIRAELKKLYGEEPDEGFESFLSEFFFDLHYQAKPEAQPINLGIGHLWKLAIDYPESEVLPCLHRAPKEKTGEPRLMMIC